MDFKDKIINNAILILASDKLNAEAKKIKKKHGIPEGGINEDNIKDFKEEDIHACCNDVYKLKTKYNLPEPYFVPLMSIIVYSKLPSKELMDLITPFYLKVEEERDGNKSLYIKIYPETTGDDIKKNWAKIEEKKKKIYGYSPTKTSKRKRLYRDMQMKILHEKGHDPQSIAKAIGKVFHKQSKNNILLQYNDVLSIIFKLRKRGNEKLKEISNIK